MKRTTMRRLAALALGAVISAGSGVTAHAGGNCATGWNAPASKQDAAGRTFTWHAGAT